MRIIGDEFMKNKFKLLACFSIFLVLVAGATFIVHSQRQDDKGDKNRRKIQENLDPLVDLRSPEINNPNQLRKNRNKKFNIKDRSVRPEQLQNFQINENSPEFNFGGPLSNLRNQPAFPLAKSSHVVVGTINRGQAFLSDDRISVYSEFELNVEQTLKQSSNRPILTDQLAVVRKGGKIRLPSGKVLHRGFEGQPLPKSGKRYLLFLDFDAEMDSFYIVTAYELQAGRVMPLDGRNFDDIYFRPYRAYQQYEGMGENEFLTLVRNVIAQGVIQ